MRMINNDHTSEEVSQITGMFQFLACDDESVGWNLTTTL